jgi:hypothetical protein
MGIGISVRVFVVLAVITHPYVHGVLGKKTHKINTRICLSLCARAHLANQTNAFRNIYKQYHFHLIEMENTLK